MCRKEKNIIIDNIGAYFYENSNQVINEFISTEIFHEISKYKLDSDLDLLIKNIFQENTNIDVRIFGAKGDGLNNDSRSIQSAIDLCEKNGKVNIPSGTYLIEDTIHLRSNITLELDRNATIITSTKLKNKPIFLGDRVNNVRIRGGKFYGEVSENKFANLTIKFNESSNIVIENINIFKFQNSIIIKQSNNCKVYKCDIYNIVGDETGGIGILFEDSYDSVAHSNVIDSVYQDGILVYNNSYNIYICNNIIKNWNLENDHGRGGIQSYFSHDILIKDNIIYCDDNKTIFDFSAQRIGVRSRDCYNIVINSNTIRDCQGMGVDSVFLGDNYRYNHENIKIIGNYISNVYGVGISNTNIINNKKLIDNVIIANNKIDGVKFIDKNKTGNGIISKALNHNIKNNIVENCADTCITAIGEGKPLIINNNIMKNAGLEYRAIHRSNLFISGTGVIISENIFLDFQLNKTTKYAIKLYGRDSKAIIYKNVILNNLESKIDGVILQNYE